MAGKKKQTGPADEPGFFSDLGYGKGTAITILRDTAGPAKTSGRGGKARGTKKRK